MIGHVHRPERVAGMASRQLIARAASSSSALPANGKNVVITGANTGIGVETAKNLSKQGYNLTLVCRDERKAEAAKQLIIDAGTEAEVKTEQMDLADLSSVRDCTSRMLDQGRQIDVLINNAGVMACPEMQTKDGLEYQLGVNHLGHFEFTNRLLPLLAGRSSRIVNVSSSAHTFGTINFQNINLRGEYQPWPAYGQSKLANVLFTYEMARRLPPASRITVNALHPGVVKTELGRYLLPENPAWWQILGIELLRKAPWLLEPEQGAATSIYLASSPEVEAMSSKYWVDSKTAESSAESYDVDVARRFWELSQEMTGCDIDVAAAAARDSVTSSTS